MSHYEDRLERDLSSIRKRVATIGETVHDALKHAVIALLNRDRAMANDVILGDLRVNRLSRELDGKCHRFVARHLPSAGNLRYVSSVLRLSIALERIGDYAETISRTACHITAPTPSPVAKDVDMMSDQACRTLKASMKAFNEVNPDLARGTLAMAGQFAPTFDKVFADLIREGEAQTLAVPELFHLMATFNRLERVIHQAKNICEEAIFSATGETKGPKSYSVLFVDKTDNGPAQLAAAYANKVRAEGATFESAGIEAASEVDPAYVAFADEHGLDIGGGEPRAIGPLQHQLDDFGILVDLTGKTTPHLPTLPYHTVVLDWSIDPSAGPETVYRQIVEELSLLLEKLSGEAET